MKQLVEKTLSLYEKGDFASAESSCLEYISCCRDRFMEELTVNTATDFLGAVTLLGQIYGEIKKPWKIFPSLEDARGCIRFLVDFMQDRDMVYQAVKSSAELYARGGYFPEAQSLYQTAAEVCKDEKEAEDAFYFAYVYGLLSKNVISKEIRDSAIKILGVPCERELYKDASNAFFSMIKSDPVEREEKYLSVRYEVEQEVDEILSNNLAEEDVPKCIRYWRTKKKILSDKHGIDWMSPEECNPDISFCDQK